MACALEDRSDCTLVSSAQGNQGTEMARRLWGQFWQEGTVVRSRTMVVGTGQSQDWVRK